MLTIPIIFKKNNFLTNFRIFYKGLHRQFLPGFPGLNANGLEIKQQAQRGMTFRILTFGCITAAKILIF